MSGSTSRPVSGTAMAETSGTYWSFLSLSSSWSLKEIPRTGPFWIRFIKWVVKPAILFRSRLEGMMATSSAIRLLVLQDRTEDTPDGQRQPQQNEREEGERDALEVKRESRVELLDHHSRSSLDSLGAYSSLEKSKRTTTRRSVRTPGQTCLGQGSVGGECRRG